jgi:hypothetical protein
VADTPLDYGLAELVGYLSLGESGVAVVFDPDNREQIGWSDGELERVADLPRVSFSRQSLENR